MRVAAVTALGRAIGTPKYAAALKKQFPKMAAISIDYGVAEKADNISVVPADCGWSDVGSFSALPDVRPLDAGLSGAVTTSLLKTPALQFLRPVLRAGLGLPQLSVPFPITIHCLETEPVVTLHSRTYKLHEHPLVLPTRRDTPRDESTTHAPILRTV